MKSCRIILISLMVLLVTGCATNAMTGRKQLSLVSEQRVIENSSNMYMSLVEGYGKKDKIAKDPQVNERVRNITNRLVERAIEYRPETIKWKWQVNVIEDEQVNAFCMPGGKMGIYTGLLDKINPTDDELAQVMGHEISHALANHGAEKMSNQILGQIIVATAGVAAASSGSNGRYDNNRQRVAQDMAAIGALAFITLPNSRTAETEADKMGVEIAAQAGFDPNAAITIWEKMMGVTGQTSSGDFWSTHPSPPNRIEAFKALQDPMREIYEQRKTAYTKDYKPSYYFVAMGNDPIASSSNVKVITDAQGNSFSAEAPQVDPNKAQAFYSPEFAAFKAGKLEMSCTSCSLRFFMNQSDLKSMYEKQDWRSLIREVININHKADISYLYLGFAAEGMHYREAAKEYFRLAAELASTEEFSCAKSKLAKCGDFDVAEITSSKLH
ncbi:MAG TPA: M48 family metallopeptidase [Methylophilus sp.]|nr:M48 family metallopeptidase [Methylophilus sp.]